MLRTLRMLTLLPPRIRQRVAVLCTATLFLFALAAIVLPSVPSPQISRSEIVSNVMPHDDEIALMKAQPLSIMRGMNGSTAELALNMNAVPRAVLMADANFTQTANIFLAGSATGNLTDMNWTEITGQPRCCTTTLHPKLTGNPVRTTGASEVTSYAVSTMSLTAETTTPVVGEVRWLTVKLGDKYGNPVTGQVRSITLTDRVAEPQTLSWQQSGFPGDYHEALLRMLVDSHTLTVTADSITEQLSLIVQPRSGAQHVTAVDLTLTEYRADSATVASGESIAVILALSDENGQPVTLEDRNIIALSDSLSGTIPFLNWEETGSTGEYRTVLTPMQTGRHNLTAMVNGQMHGAVLTVVDRTILSAVRPQ